jgi:hypothetical protein
MPKRKNYDTKRKLVTRCKRLRVTVPMTMRRDDMILTLHRRAARVIIMAIRRHLINKEQLVNDTDPISMDDIPAGRRWLVRERDCVYQFDAEPMVQYLLSEGLFRNPFTRCEFSDRSLHRLDRLCRKLDLIGAGQVNLAEQRRILVREKSEARERARTLEFLDDECVQHLYGIVRLCARASTTTLIVDNGMELFFRTLAVLEAMDRARAEQCLIYCLEVTVVAFERSQTLPCADLRHAIYCMLSRRLRVVFGSTVFAAPIALYSRMYMFVADPNVPNTPFPSFEIVH